MLLDSNPESCPLAGGQSLVATMNVGMFQPTLLVALDAVPEMQGISRHADGSVVIGAMTTHASIAASDAFVDGQRLIPLTARQIADPAVRNFGTIGGACAHCDSIADWPCALVAAGACIVVAGLAGQREIAASDFFLGLFSTALQHGELIVSVRVPKLPGNARYRKFSRVEGDYATVSVAVVASAVQGLCVSASIAVGACGPTPARLAAAEAMLIGMRVDEALGRRAGALLAAACEPASDVRGSASYRRRVVPGLVSQTLGEVLAHA
jgi:carbon-monoxide dehydrogenase medium subunit